MGKQKIEDSILFSYNNSISHDRTTGSIVQNGNMTKGMISSQEETTFITSSENKKVIQKLEAEVKNLKYV